MHIRGTAALVVALTLGYCSILLLVPGLLTLVFVLVTLPLVVKILSM